MMYSVLKYFSVTVEELQASEQILNKRSPVILSVQRLAQNWRTQRAAARQWKNASIAVAHSSISCTCACNTHAYTRSNSVDGLRRVCPSLRTLLSMTSGYRFVQTPRRLNGSTLLCRSYEFFFSLIFYDEYELHRLWNSPGDYDRWIGYMQ